MSGVPSRDELQVKKSGIQWVVKKDVFTGDKGQSSNKFNFGFEEQTQWYLRLRPRVPSDGVIWLGLFLVTGGPLQGHINTKFKLGLITKDGKDLNVKYGKCVFDRICPWSWVNFIKLDFLLAKENDFFRNDELTIFCDLEVYRSAEVLKSSLVRDQSQLLQSGEFFDFILKVGGETIKVHRCMLSRSPVFRAMLEEEEKKENFRVEINGLDVVGVKGMLEFLYTGRVKELVKIAKLVLPTAERYGVEVLKTLCEQELCYELRPVNVADMLEFAELHTATKLKEQALTFICENATEIVEETGFWRLNESNQQLFKEVVRALAKNSQNGKPMAIRMKLN